MDPKVITGLTTGMYTYTSGCYELFHTTTRATILAVHTHSKDHPGSHQATDFIMDLLPSNGFMAIMVMIDCFSKICRLLPVKYLSIYIFSGCPPGFSVLTLTTSQVGTPLTVKNSFKSGKYFH